MDTQTSTTVQLEPQTINTHLPEAGIAGSVTVLVSLLLWLRRKWVIDSKANSIDTSEVNYYKELREELEKKNRALDECNQERNKMASQVGRLQASNEYLEREVATQSKRIAVLERRLGLNDSRPAPLGPPEV